MPATHDATEHFSLQLCLGDCLEERSQRNMTSSALGRRPDEAPVRLRSHNVYSSGLSLLHHSSLSIPQQLPRTPAMSSTPTMAGSSGPLICQLEPIAKMIELYQLCFRKEMEAALKVHGSDAKFRSYCVLVRIQTKRTLDFIKNAFAESPAPPYLVERTIQKLEIASKGTFQPFVRWSKEVQIVMCAISTMTAAVEIMLSLTPPFAYDKEETPNNITPFPLFSPTQFSAQLASMAPRATQTGLTTASTSSAKDINAEIIQRIQQLEMEKNGEISHEKIDAAAEHRKHVQAGGDTNTCDCYFCVKQRAERVGAEAQRKK